MARTRQFFGSRDVLEVDTPVLGTGVVVEATLEPIPCGRGRFLLCSPEGPMKRLLASGVGSIYQFAHAFRDGEVGQRHAEEFTMLEWYRVDFDHHALMDEVEALVRELLEVGEKPFERRTYREIFADGAEVDPFTTTLPELRAVCDGLEIPIPDGFDTGSLDDALDLILVQHIEPRLGEAGPMFLTDYPPSQAALAQVHDGVAYRFELYIDGVELANGYYELTDAGEQARRFNAANKDRAARGLPMLPIDTAMLAALESGIGPCAGVALGFDRLLMLAAGVTEIADVRSLPFER